MIKRFTLLIVLFTLVSGTAFGQSERTGQAGAMELLNNVMPRSSGFNGLDIAGVDGIEGSQINPAGVARTTGTELLFAHSRWLYGSGIQINSFGISQSLGVDNGTLGVLVVALNPGDLTRTTESQPNGELGTFSPSLLNIGLTYARKFTDRIHVGFSGRLVSQSTPDVAATGVNFDAGIQYRAGKLDRLKLGIALRHVGPTMTFSGDGLTSRVLFQTRNDYTTSVDLPTQEFEIPATLTMGGSFDFFLGSDDLVLSAVVGFISNSYYYNQGGMGLEFRYKQYVAFRGAFLYEQGIFGANPGVDGRYNAYTGTALGASFRVPIKSGKYDASGNPDFSKFSLDMSYRTTNPFGGTFVLGARIDI